MKTNKENGFDNPTFDSRDDSQSITNGQVVDNLPNDQSQERQRAQWGNGIEFLMSCVAMSVGLGNIWRFPFTAYENGGGAFLIPYLIVLVVVGRPLYYMEMGLGQFSNRGNVRFYKSLSPYLKGVGYGQVMATVFVGSYYSSLISITLFYFVNSFTAVLPWGKCTEEWIEELKLENVTCVDAIAKGNYSNLDKSISSAELYFRKEVLKEITDLSGGIGYPDWRLALCLLFSWMVAFLISFKGIQSSGKVSYFLAIFPYVIMIALLIRAATLEGAATGIYYFIKTDWGKLAEADVWYAAVTQCFFSLNVGFGAIMMFSSYNSFDHNINRDALIVTTLDTFTSLLSGVTVFAILGNLAHNLQVTPDKVIKSGGTGLAFMSYPDAIAKMEAVPWLMAILFFFMLFVLGIGSLVALHGTINTVVQDHFPRMKKWQVSGITALCVCSIALIYVTPGGQFMLNLVDYYAGTFVVFVFILAEVIGVSWAYGLENFCLDMEFMLKTKVSAYWRITWGLLTPLFLIAVFIYFCIKFDRLTYGGHEYPDGILAFGWAILGVAVAQALFWVIYEMYKNRNFGFLQMIYNTFTYDHWGPSGQANYQSWKMFKQDIKRQRWGQKKGFFRKYFEILTGRSR